MILALDCLLITSVQGRTNYKGLLISTLFCIKDIQLTSVTKVMSTLVLLLKDIHTTQRTGAMQLFRETDAMRKNMQAYGLFNRCPPYHCTLHFLCSLQNHRSNFASFQSCVQKPAHHSHQFACVQLCKLRRCMPLCLELLWFVRPTH